MQKKKKNTIIIIFFKIGKNFKVVQNMTFKCQVWRERKQTKSKRVAAKLRARLKKREKKNRMSPTFDPHPRKDRTLVVCKCQKENSLVIIDIKR